jgi:hypothetical protein
MTKLGTIIVAAAAAVLLAVPAQEASAQACAGWPAGQGQFSVGPRFAGAAWTGDDVGGSFGVEAGLNRVGNAAVFGYLDLVSGINAEDRDPVIGFGAAYEVGNLVPALPGWVSVCPVASVAAHRIDGTTYFSVPLGLGFGTEVGAPGALTVLPYAIPQFQLFQAGLDDITWDHRFGIGFGALARIGNVGYAGVEFNRAFVDGADFDLALRGGITFPR